MLAASRLLRPPFAGHPDYDTETKAGLTPRPKPRVKPEAQEFAERNRGSINISWTNDSPRTAPNSAYSGRYRSTAAFENLMKSRGSIGTIMSWGSSCRTEPVKHRAIKAEALETAEQHRGGRMNLLLTNYGKNEVTPRPVPRVKSEASDNYQKASGLVMNNLLHDASNMPKSARPGPRIKPEAEDIAQKNRGSMSFIMRQCTPRY